MTLLNSHQFGQDLSLTSIIDMARRSQASHEQVGLFLIHVQSVLKCFHVLCYNVLEKVCQPVRPPAGGRQCTHLLESSGSLAAFLVGQPSDIFR